MKIKPFSFFKKKQTGGVAPPFATGVDGDLTITNGQTVNITAGQTYQYDNLDIQSGGILEITGPSSDLTQIVCRSSCNVEGEIVSRSVESAGYSISGTTVSGLAYSHTATQRSGGSGGRGANDNSAEANNTNGYAAPGFGGTQSQGCGGGGGGGMFISLDFNGTTQVEDASDGGSNSDALNVDLGRGSSNVISLGGVSNLFNNSTSGIAGDGRTSQASTYQLKTSGDGGSGGGAGAVARYEDKNGTFFQGISAGGGGGGSRGKHGGSIFLFFAGSITGTGLINVSGQNGFSGGNGGRGSNSGDIDPNNAGSGFAGGGGGGGAGGSGGSVIIQSGGDALSTNISGGSGGSAGSAGSPAGTTPSTPAQSGTSGQSGLSGSVSKVAYP